MRNEWYISPAWNPEDQMYVRAVWILRFCAACVGSEQVSRASRGYAVKFSSRWPVGLTPHWSKSLDVTSNYICFAEEVLSLP